MLFLLFCSSVFCTESGCRSVTPVDEMSSLPGVSRNVSPERQGNASVEFRPDELFPLPPPPEVDWDDIAMQPTERLERIYRMTVAIAGAIRGCGSTGLHSFPAE